MVREGGEEPRQETQKEQRPRGNLFVIIPRVVDRGGNDRDLDPNLGNQPGSDLVKLTFNFF